MKKLQQVLWPMAILFVLACFSLRLSGLQENVLNDDGAAQLVSGTH